MLFKNLTGKKVAVRTEPTHLNYKWISIKPNDEMELEYNYGISLGLIVINKTEEVKVNKTETVQVNKTESKIFEPVKEVKKGRPKK